jgi:redox-sensitive bicupin YhaK (pirin superfamily)
MTTGLGTQHKEKLPAADKLLVVQLWFILPAKDKMAPPAITASNTL